MASLFLQCFFLFYLRAIFFLFVLILFPLLVDPESSSGALLEAFELLSKRLRLLEEIPLRISSVQPLDPGFISS